MVVVIEKNANGKIELTKDELQELLEQARQEGINDYLKRNWYVVNTPIAWSDYNKTTIPYTFTCTSASEGKTQ